MALRGRATSGHRQAQGAGPEGRVVRLIRRAAGECGQGACGAARAVRRGRCHADALYAPQAFKGADVLKDISWEVKKGERVGLVGWNGAGKTTQLKLITGELEPDAGAIIRAKSNMKIAFLNQEFEVVMTRTVRRSGARRRRAAPDARRGARRRRSARSSCPPLMTR